MRAFKEETDHGVHDGDHDDAPNIVSIGVPHDVWNARQ
jgi:hypothetical protein